MHAFEAQLASDDDFTILVYSNSCGHIMLTNRKKNVIFLPEKLQYSDILFIFAEILFTFNKLRL